MNSTVCSTETSTIASPPFATVSQRAAANLGQCCLELKLIGSKPALAIYEEIKPTVGQIEALGKCHADDNGEKKAFPGPTDRDNHQLSAIENLRHCLYLLREYHSKKSHSIRVFLGPYLRDIAAMRIPSQAKGVIN